MAVLGGLSAGFAGKVSTTLFERKVQAVETIIPMLEDGTWKVMTYRVR